MAVLGVLKAVASLTQLAGSLGWFGETKWSPTNIDPAMEQFKTLLSQGAITQEEYNKLKSLRDKAYSYYKKHHSALPWDKPHYQKLFNNAVKAFWAEANAIAQKVREEQEEAGVAFKMPDYLKWLLVGGAGVGGILATIYFTKKK